MQLVIADAADTQMALDKKNLNIEQCNLWSLRLYVYCSSSTFTNTTFAINATFDYDIQCT